MSLNDLSPSFSRNRRNRRGCRTNQRGFTLIELIMVLVMLGVLAVVAIPRMVSMTDFTARGFHDETLSLLRYAQKAAIAQRRVVCVALNPTGITLTMDTDTPPDATCNAAPPMALPNTPRGGTGLAATVSSVAVAGFSFSPLGATDQGASVNITIANSSAITVEAQTGFVHD